MSLRTITRGDAAVREFRSSVIAAMREGAEHLSQSLGRRISVTEAVKYALYESSGNNGLLHMVGYWTMLGMGPLAKRYNDAPDMSYRQIRPGSKIFALITK